MAEKNLSISDAYFALTLTVSPVSVYLIYSTIFRFFRRRPNRLYRSLDSTSKRITCVLSIVLLIWWIVYNLLIYLGSTSQGQCGRSSVHGWLLYEMYTTQSYHMQFFVVFTWLIPFMWIIYLVRHFKDIRGEYRRYISKKNTPAWAQGRFGWLYWLGRIMKSCIISQWDVITRSHSWLFPYTVLLCYFAWANALLIWLVDLSSGSEHSKDDYKPLGYGQLLALGIAIGPLWSTLKLTYSNRQSLGSWLKRCPRSIWNGTVFIFTGHRNPWKQIQEEEGTRTNSTGVVYEQLVLPVFIDLKNPGCGKVEDLQASTQEFRSDEGSNHEQHLEEVQMPMRAYRS
ncbi:hypothetical protein PM082_004057 [Marasmius tenuissimus]|nr:hypothetical protein PM082_004057 [Marasmius tenuissimus]